MIRRDCEKLVAEAHTHHHDLGPAECQHRSSSMNLERVSLVSLTASQAVVVEETATETCTMKGSAPASHDKIEDRPHGSH